MNPREIPKERDICRKCGVKLIRNKNIRPLFYDLVINEGHYWEQYCDSCEKTVDLPYKIAEQQQYKKLLAEGRIKQFNEWVKGIKPNEPFKTLKKKIQYKSDNPFGKSSLNQYTCTECGETKYSKNPPEDGI